MVNNLLVNPSRRVVLNQLALHETVQGQKLMAVAMSIPAAGARTDGPGSETTIRTISASALTRYLSGERKPALKVALTIAAAVGLDPVELILGWAPDRRRSKDSWEVRIGDPTAWPTGMNLSALVSIFRNIIGYLHSGYVVEGGPHRRALHSPPGVAGFGVFDVRVDPACLPTAIRLLFSLPIDGGIPLVVDFGELTVERDKVTARDLWTYRTDVQAAADTPGAFRVRVWLGGSATVFYLISDRPFNVSTADAPGANFLVRAEDDGASGCVVSFLPSAFQGSPDVCGILNRN